MDARIARELKLLRKVFGNIRFVEEGRWVLLPQYELPKGVWVDAETSLAVQFPPGFPGNGPYGFHVTPPPKLVSGQTLRNVAASNEPPFAGEWLKFSWSLPEWKATADVCTGHNMLNFVLTIRNRLEEGA